MGELIHTSIDQEAGFEEPEPPSSKLRRLTSLYDEAWDKYRTTSGDRGVIVDNLYALTAELRETFAEYRTTDGTEADLPIEVQTALMCIRQPILPAKSIVTPEHSIVKTSDMAVRPRQSRRMGADAVNRMATLRNSY